ncbi:hypothetical protein [Desulfovibrio sp. ZJ369]|uniref:hypothetical protein n=1 Tax=Desulfovibrio sp. ZJ369 TaxID=2709793 RepID=UPI00197D7002|nr:hypothetical protein [Desulfovibrio sp. ZJ369]
MATAVSLHVFCGNSLLSPSVASFVATAEAWTRNDGSEVIENEYFQSKNALEGMLQAEALFRAGICRAKEMALRRQAENARACYDTGGFAQSHAYFPRGGLGGANVRGRLPHSP